MYLFPSKLTEIHITTKRRIKQTRKLNLLKKLDVVVIEKEFLMYLSISK